MYVSVTEKVWESESASEAEEPVKKEAKKSAPIKAPAKVVPLHQIVTLVGGGVKEITLSVHVS